MQRLPDSDHVFGRLHCHLVVERRERVHARDRVTDGGVDEEQDAIEHVARHVDCLGRRHDRLAKIVTGDAAGLCARNAQRLSQIGGKVLTVARERRRF
jgi:hypothetical protein